MGISAEAEGNRTKFNKLNFLNTSRFLGIPTRRNSRFSDPLPVRILTNIKIPRLASRHFNICGVYWTKFETISSRIQRTNAPRTLAIARNPKPKIFLPFLDFRRGVWGEPTKNGKENFWFWFRRFIPPERTCIYILALWRYFVRPFLRHSRRCEAQVSFVKILRILSEIHSNFVQYTPHQFKKRLAKGVFF